MMGTFPTPAALGFKIVVPFMNQIATLPLVSCHRTSLLPSPLKSPVPTIDQVVGTFPTPAVLGFKTVVPFISQIARLPRVVSRQRMSHLPSPLKSPVPTMDQLVGTFPTAAVLGFKTVVPFISQMATLPLVSRHRMSHLPSPLKSPVPTMDQLVGTFPTAAVLGFKTVVPFISQIATLPLVSRHRMSHLPSPSKSPVPTMDQVVGRFPTPAALGFKTVVPFISQIATLPPVSRQAMSLLPSALKSWELTIVSANRPIWLADCSVNHSAPSGPCAMPPWGLTPAVGILNSVITPSVVIRPIWLAIISLN